MQEQLVQHQRAPLARARPGQADRRVEPKVRAARPTLRAAPALAASGVAVARCSRRYRAGGVPNRRLKARLNADSDSYPTSAAMSATPRGVVVNACAASCRRHRIKYAI